MSAGLYNAISILEVDNEWETLFNSPAELLEHLARRVDTNILGIVDVKNSHGLGRAQADDVAVFELLKAGDEGVTDVLAECDKNHASHAIRDALLGSGEVRRDSLILVVRLRSEEAIALGIQQSLLLVD